MKAWRAQWEDTPTPSEPTTGSLVGAALPVPVPWQTFLELRLGVDHRDHDADFRAIADRIRRLTERRR
jgi:hypothetical protein